jgi:hypothetical protein
METQRGDQVLVRTFGGFPRVRRLWAVSPPACIVVEDEWLPLLQEGDETWAVAVPIEDVFRYDPGTPVDPDRPFPAWEQLTPLTA